MQLLLLTLLIGTAFAMVNAAPAQNKLQSLQALLEGDDDHVRMDNVILSRRSPDYETMTII